jgi:hypothetical protein
MTTFAAKKEIELPPFCKITSLYKNLTLLSLLHSNKKPYLCNAIEKDLNAQITVASIVFRKYHFSIKVIIDSFKKSYFIVTNSYFILFLIHTFPFSYEKIYPLPCCAYRNV